jgi:glycosyltransferase involved in cell wall biosynthesis
MIPLVSVIIPSYNHASYISEAVNSVLTQSSKKLELIVVDDGSKDESVEILKGFSDSRIRLLTQENQGAHAAINRGLEESHGKYLSILNSDDIYLPQRLEKLVDWMESDPSLGLIASNIEVIDQNGKKLGVKEGYHNLEPWVLPFPKRSFRAGDDLRAALLTENFLATTSNYLFSRQVFEKIGPFRPLRYAHDWDFALRVAQISQLALYPEPLMRYRVHPTNTISENQAAMIFEICWILAVHLPQQIADDSWFGTLPLAQRIDQLLYSIYTYNCDRVLNGMLLQELSRKMDSALSLLQSENAVRLRYLDYIINQLDNQDAIEQIREAQMTSLLRKFWRKLKVFFE